MTSRSRRTRAASAAALLALVSLTACGESLQARIEFAMDGCLAQRRPVFRAGNGESTAGTPLPAVVDSVARLVAYPAGLDVLKEIAEIAPDQATLVCTLDVASRFRDEDTRVFIRTYLAHPDAAVASWARALLAGPDLK